MHPLRRALSAAALALTTALTPLAAARAAPWDIAKAAAPYKGTELHVIFLDRPGYRAIEKLLPQFEQQTGIKITYDVVPYESTHEKEVLNFAGSGDLDIVLVDLVWLGEFAENGWIQPVSKFTSDAAITDPNLDLAGLLPTPAQRFRQLGQAPPTGCPSTTTRALLFYNSAARSRAAGFDQTARHLGRARQHLRAQAHPSRQEPIRLFAAVRARRDAVGRQLHALSLAVRRLAARQELPLEPDEQAQSQDGPEFPAEPHQIHAAGRGLLGSLGVGQCAGTRPGGDDHRMVGVLSDADGSEDVEDRRLPGVAPEPRVRPDACRHSAASRSPSPRRHPRTIRRPPGSSSSGRPRMRSPAPMSRRAACRGACAIYERPRDPREVQLRRLRWSRPGSSGVPEFRPRFPAWPQISEIIGEWGSKMMLGQTSVAEGSKEIGTRMEAVLARKATTTARRSCSSKRLPRWLPARASWPTDGGPQRFWFRPHRPCWPSSRWLIGIYPTLFALVTSLRQYNLARVRDGFPFVGLANYVSVLTDGSFWQTLGRTGLFFICVMPAEVGSGTDGGAPASPGPRTSWLRASDARVAGDSARDHLRGGGLLGRLIFNRDFGIADAGIAGGRHRQPVDWLGSPAGAFIAICMMDIWQWTPFVRADLPGSGLSMVPGRHRGGGAPRDHQPNWALLRDSAAPLSATRPDRHADPALGRRTEAVRHRLHHDARRTRLIDRAHLDLHPAHRLSRVRHRRRLGPGAPAASRDHDRAQPASTSASSTGRVV